MQGKGEVVCCDHRAMLFCAWPITPRAGEVHFGPREGECTLGQGSQSIASWGLFVDRRCTTSHLLPVFHVRPRHVIPGYVPTAPFGHTGEPRQESSHRFLKPGYRVNRRRQGRGDASHQDPAWGGDELNARRRITGLGKKKEVSTGRIQLYQGASFGARPAPRPVDTKPRLRRSGTTR